MQVFFDRYLSYKDRIEDSALIREIPIKENLYTRNTGQRKPVYEKYWSKKTCIREILVKENLYTRNTGQRKPVFWYILRSAYQFVYIGN